MVEDTTMDQRSNQRTNGIDGTDGIDRPDVVVIGAGIAGLSAALALSAAGRRVLVLDAHQPGGRARTTEQQGFLHNLGPHAVYRSGALADVLREHGIRITGGTPGQGVTMVVRDGRATALALRPADLLRTSLLGRVDRVRLLAMFVRLQRADASRLVGRSLADWLDGTPEPVRQFAEMFARVATYTDAPDLVDAGATIAQMQMALDAGVQYVDGGWGSFIRSMLEVLEQRGEVVRTGVEVRSVETDGREARVHTDGGTVDAAAVVIAAGGPDVAARLSGTSVADARHLTPPVLATTLDLAVIRPRDLVAFGLDEPLYMSTHAPVARLAPDGDGLLSLQHYHRPGTEPASPDEERARLRAFARRAGVGDETVSHDRYLHRVVVSHGAPTALGGGLAGRPTVDALGLGNVLVAGDWVGDVGWIADAAAASGTAAARALVARRASIAR
jgi:glycine/D-amino acid oxidase-like deaminating enzyme